MEKIPYDVYTDFPHHLQLTDLRSFCQAHPRACANPVIKNKLSYIYNEVNIFLDELNYHYIIIQPPTYLQFGILHNMMKHIGIYEPVDEDDEENIHPSDIFNNYFVISITINKINNYTYTIRFEMDRKQLSPASNQLDFDVSTFYCQKLQLKEFLLQMYYDDLIYKTF